MKDEKLRDVQTLLIKHFGDNWQDMDNLSYFRNIINCNSLKSITNNEEKLCDYHEETCGLLV